MDRLWTPWRYSYITGAGEDARKGVPTELAAWPIEEDHHCVFCNLIASVNYAIERGMDPESALRAGLIVDRRQHNFICLNRFPYTGGHLLIVPYLHIDSLAKLPEAAAIEMVLLAQGVEDALRNVYRPDGINLGMNLGASAGAGVAGHLHLHALPRWTGDTNFMTVIGETRVLPEILEDTWTKLEQALPKGQRKTF